ncbi:hypothetical protein CH373_04690 [Leptospira perolatii]|uniref:Uncharacterized protein n=1 Tax=Leptospira perolatii TaxID=2023191 RepID=A0A2M9ZQK6_9LEPT|nr:hypothetical protein [Leptospira perolatii]PJZ68320.1 hypothetical protein CH360_16905 [Leptospira perolatii]PJZ74213.1 hypothetical protein CH373_04690 [Leptospira perolatii]
MGAIAKNRIEKAQTIGGSLPVFLLTSLPETPSTGCASLGLADRTSPASGNGGLDMSSFMNASIINAHILSSIKANTDKRLLFKEVL